MAPIPGPYGKTTSLAEQKFADGVSYGSHEVLEDVLH